MTLCRKLLRFYHSCHITHLTRHRMPIKPEFRQAHQRNTTKHLLSLWRRTSRWSFRTGLPQCMKMEPATETASDFTNSTYTRALIKKNQLDQTRNGSEFSNRSKLIQEWMPLSSQQLVRWFQAEMCACVKELHMCTQKNLVRFWHAKACENFVLFSRQTENCWHPVKMFYIKTAMKILSLEWQE